MNFCNVIVIKDGVVEENHLVQGENCSLVTVAAEEIFADLARTYISNWDEYSKEDLEAVFDNGYEEFGNGSICISWAEIIKDLDKNKQVD